MTTDLNTRIKKELIENAGMMLVSKGIQDYNVEKPKYPTCIFYLGKTSESYMEEMNNDLTRGWGDSAAHVKHYRVSDADRVLETITNFENTQITLERLRHDVTEIMSMPDVFDDMQYINIYTIIETSSMSADVFEKWYHFIETIQKALPVSLRTALIIILNQSLDHIEESDKIRERLLSIYNSSEIGGEKTHLYDSVFLFSNRLRNGSFINLKTDSKEYEEYNLFADLILLTNTNTADNAQQLDKLYNRNTPAITAAYSHLSKPAYDITMITLKRCLNRIKGSIGNSNTTHQLDQNIVSKVLRISNGSMPVIDEFYRMNIQPKIIQALAALEYLPTRRICNNLPYTSADEETQGCLSAFVKINCIEVSKSIIEANRTALISQIKAHIIESMTLEQQKSFHYYVSDIGKEVDSLLAINVQSDFSHANVTDAIKTITRKEVIAQFAPLVTEALEEIRASSGASINLFSEVYDCVNKMNVGSSGDLFQRIHEFYEDIVDLYYVDRSKVEKITKEITSECKSYDDLFKALLGELSNIFASNSIYGMSFVDELTERLRSKGDNLNIGALITKELLQSIDKKLALYSYSVFPEHYFEAYFINTNRTDDHSPVKALTERADKLHIPVLCQNTLSNERIETIWFYRCSEDNIRS